MKYLIIILEFLLISCKETKFPNEIKSYLSDKHFRIKGTKLFVKNIDDFQFIPDINMFKQSDSVFIHCLYTPGNFLKDFNSQKFNFYHNHNYKIISYQNFLINGYNGVYYKLIEGKSYWLYFIFGDSLIENRIVATYPVDKSFEKPIFNFVKSIYYKSDFVVNPLENAKFDFDLLNSDFEFSTFSMNTYAFGQKTENKNVRPNYIFFSQTPPAKDSLTLKRTLNIVINNIKNNGVFMKSVKIIDNIEVDSNIAYIAEIKGFSENKDFYTRLIITSNSEYGLLFGASLYHDIDKNLPVIDKILQTVKLK